MASTLESATLCRLFRQRLGTPLLAAVFALALVGLSQSHLVHPMPEVNFQNSTETVQLQAEGCPATCGEAVQCEAGAEQGIIDRACPRFVAAPPEIPEIPQRLRRLQVLVETTLPQVEVVLTDCYAGTGVVPPALGYSAVVSWTVQVNDQSAANGYRLRVGRGEVFEFFDIENGDFAYETESQDVFFRVISNNIAEFLIEAPNGPNAIFSTIYADDTFNFWGPVENFNNGLPPIFVVQLTTVSISLPDESEQVAPGSEQYTCPGTSCSFPIEYQNNDFCNCLDCADEDSWTCDTCGVVPPTPPVDGEEPTQEEKNVATGIGVGVGVGTGLALGIGLGVGLGTGIGAGTGSAAGGASGAAAVAAIGAAFSATGTIRVNVQDPSLLNSEAFTNAIKESIARLAGGTVVAAMVELIIGCVAGRRLWPDAEGWRRLAQAVDVCFKIGANEKDVAQELCDTISSFDVSTVQTVVQQEVRRVGLRPTDVDVIGYEPNPNPLANNPGVAPGQAPAQNFVPNPQGISLDS